MYNKKYLPITQALLGPEDAVCIVQNCLKKKTDFVSKPLWYIVVGHIPLGEIVEL